MFALMQPPFHAYQAPSFSTHASNPLAPRDSNARPFYTPNPFYATKMSPPSSTNQDENAQSHKTTIQTLSKPSSTSLFSPSFTTTSRPSATNTPSSLSSSSASSSTTRPRPTHIRGSKYSSLPTNKSSTDRPAQRRQKYLAKVRDARDERRHEQRGDASERLRWFEERRAWCLEREREGASYLDGAADDEVDQMMLMSAGNGDGDGSVLDEDEVERLAREEQMYAEMADEVEGAEGDEFGADSEMTEYGSEDEDYERLMLDIAMQVEGEQQGLGQGLEWASSGRMGDQGMDMS